MLNYIWFGMIVVGIVAAVLNGRIDMLTDAVLSSATKAVELCIGLVGIICLWTGLMSVAERSGLVKKMSSSLRPVLKFLFPEIPRNHPAMGAVVMNMTANFLGLGNAATPLGLKAMRELQRLNPEKSCASNSMCMFLVINTSAVQLVPATVIAVRSACGSQNPSEIIGTIWVASLCASITGIIASKIFSIMENREMR